MADVDNYLEGLSDTHWQLQEKQSENPFVVNYALEMDNNPALDQELASSYQYLIGMLMWMVEIGRVDIIIEVSIMSSYMAIPMEGHLGMVLHVFAFLRQK